MRALRSEVQARQVWLRVEPVALAEVYWLCSELAKPQARDDLVVLQLARSAEERRVSTAPVARELLAR